jgi:hypothetical protein
MYQGPDQFATSEVVFGGFSGDNLPQGIPPDNKIAQTYEVPFYDIFREARVAASQAQFFVERVDEDNGVILASQSRPVGRALGTFIRTRGVNTGWIETEKRFYIIAVRELSGESTEVAIIDKVQFQCRSDNKLPGQANQCREFTEVRWPTGTMKNVEALQTFHTFLSNNLIAAGLL